MTRLAYIGRGGTPRVVPTGFYWTGEQVIVATAATAPKVAGCTTGWRGSRSPRKGRGSHDFGAGPLPRFLQVLVDRTIDR